MVKIRLFSWRQIILSVIWTAILTGASPAQLFSQNANNFGFFGYMRSGFGLDGQGGPHDVFRAPNSEAKYRLGNEAEAYVEALFRYAFEDDNNSLFETNLRLAFVTPTSKSNQFLTTTSVREAYVLSRGVINSQPTLAFWAGQRYYDRIDAHMNDYFYRDMSGFGGGFEDLQLGSRLKLAVAFLGGSIDELSPNGSVRPQNEFMFNKTTLDMRLYDLETGFGKLGFTFALSNFNGDSLVTDDGTYHISSNTGWSAGLFHEKSFPAGRNLLNIFYGSGSAENYRAVIQQPMGIVYSPGETIDVGSFRRFRIVEDFTADFNDHFSLMGLLIYQRLDNGLDQNNILNWFSGGIRPVYHFSRYISLAAEAGLDHTIQDNAIQGSLLKMTLAPQITPTSKIMSRPALRAYITYAWWSDEFIGLVAPNSYPDRSAGLSFGLQMEVWW